MFGGRKFFPNDSTGCLLMVLQHHPQWARPTWRLLRLRRPWLSRKSLLELLCCTCVCVQSVVRSADAGESYADPWRHSAVCDRCCHEACVGGKTNYDGSICTTKGTVYYGRSRIAYWSIASQRDNDRLNDIGRARHLYNMENEIPLDSVPIHLVVKLRYKGLRSMIGHWSFHSYLRTRLLFSRASSPGILSSWTHLPSQFSRNSSIWCILAMSTPTATLSAVISKILRFSTQWSGFHYM